MSETKVWFRRARYSPLNLVVLLVITLVTMGGGMYWITRGLLLSVTTWQGEMRAAMFASPLPRVAISADESCGKTFQKDYDLTKDWVTRYAPLWHRLYQPLKGKPGINYLEIGAYEGGSVVWMLENILTDPTSRATVIDVFDGPYKDKYLANLKRSGFADKVTTLTGFSQVVLRGLPLGSFDIIYVDGSHVTEDVLEDAVLSWRLLKVGGIMVFDNYLLFENAAEPGIYQYPKFAIDPFIQCFKCRCEVLHNGEQLIIQKTRE